MGTALNVRDIEADAELQELSRRFHVLRGSVRRRSVILYGLWVATTMSSLTAVVWLKYGGLAVPHATAEAPKTSSPRAPGQEVQAPLAPVPAPLLAAAGIRPDKSQWPPAKPAPATPSNLGGAKPAIMAPKPDAGRNPDALFAIDSGNAAAAAAPAQEPKARGASAAMPTAARRAKYGEGDVITLTDAGVVVFDHDRKTPRLIAVGASLPDGAVLMSIQPKANTIGTDRGDVVFD